MHTAHQRFGLLRPEKGGAHHQRVNADLRQLGGVVSIDAAVGLLLVWLLLPRFGTTGYVFSIFATELLNFALSAARLSRVSAFRLQPLCWLLTAAAATGGWWLLRLLFGGLLAHTEQLPVLLLSALLYLLCYAAALFLSGALRREELLWLFSLLHPQKR